MFKFQLGRIGFGVSEKERERTLFGKIIESAPSAIVLVDKEGKIVLVNAEMERLFGYAREDLIGQPVEIFVPERFRPQHPSYRTNFFSKPSARPMGAGRDLYGRHRNGNEFPIEIGLQPIETDHGFFVLAGIIDITERKRAEERFRRVVESAPNGMVLVNKEGRIMLINAETEKLFGYSRDALIGQSIEILIPQRFRQQHPSLRSNFFITPSARRMGAGRDLYGLHREGREFPIEIGLNPIDSDDGMMVLASIIDISERKSSEESMRRLLQETQQTSSVLASVSGEILSVTTQVASGSMQTDAAVSQTMTTVQEVKQTAYVAAEKARHVSATAQQTGQVSQRGKKLVDESIEAMQRIQEQMRSIADSVVRLAEQGLAIGEIIATVNDLAEQSNLLAVNAAIEAAKAGEQGKGFAVVAQEVRSLAEQSKQATAQVRSILGDIQRATGTAVAAAEQGGKTVEAGVKLSEEVGDSIRALADSIDEAARAGTQIAVSAQQQLAGMDQLSVAMENIGTASSQNMTSSKQAERSAQNLHDLGQKLQHLLASYKR